MSYIVKNYIYEVIYQIQNDLKILCQWFSGNQIKGNTQKCHFLHNAASNISLTVENEKKYIYIIKK